MPNETAECAGLTSRSGRVLGVRHHARTPCRNGGGNVPVELPGSAGGDKSTRNRRDRAIHLRRRVHLPAASRSRTPSPRIMPPRACPPLPVPPGGRDADGGHVGHHRRGRAYRPHFHLPVDRWREEDISGATGSSHLLTTSEQGQTVQVKVTFTDDANNQETLTSEATVTVTPAPNRDATGAPNISGTVQVDETLAVSTSDIADEDGLNSVSYSYQWIRVDGSQETDIAGETSSSYTLVLADQGKTIKVKVSFTDDRNNAETLTSEATVAVAAAPNRDATGAPTISGTPQVEKTLTADTSAIADEDGLDNVSYNYQWIAGGSDIDGATGSTYMLTSSEQGQTIQVRVTFTDDANNQETLTSEETVEVAAAPEPLTVRLKVDAPTTHDGSSEFTFEIEFSEEFGLSYVTLKSHAFNVTGRIRGEGAKNGQAQQYSLAHHGKAARQRGRDHRTPGNHGLRRPEGRLHRRRQELSNSLNFTVSGPGQ